MQTISAGNARQSTTATSNAGLSGQRRPLVQRHERTPFSISVEQWRYDARRGGLLPRQGPTPHCDARSQKMAGPHANIHSLPAEKGSMNAPRLVVIGNGMAGIRTIEELLALAPGHYDITVFGAEPHPNYNRILLSPVLAGEQTFNDIVLNPLDWY